MKSCIATFALLAWMALSGASVFYCSSGNDLVIKSGVSSNSAPTASDGSLTVQVNVPISGFMQASDEDGDDLIFSVVISPALGVVKITDTSTGAFNYTSSAVGSDSFSFKVSDGRADSNVATIFITVAEVQLSWRPADQLDSRGGSPGLGDTVPRPEMPCSPVEANYGPAVTSFPTVTDPFDCAHLVTAVAGPRLLHSTDGGLSWSEPEINALLSGEDEGVLVHFSAYVPGLIYVAINESGGHARLFRSFDGGIHWRVISVSLPGQVERLRSYSMDDAGCVRLRALFSRHNKEFSALDCPYGS